MRETHAVTAHVSWIHVAPIKALAIQELAQVELGPIGVEDDRRFCIVDPDGRRLNAKRVQRFVAVRPHFDDAMRNLVLEMPDGSKVKGAVDLGPAMTVTISERRVPAHFVEGPWSRALSAVAGEPAHLARVDGPGGGVGPRCEGAGASP